MASLDLIRKAQNNYKAKLQKLADLEKELEDKNKSIEILQNTIISLENKKSEYNILFAKLKKENAALKRRNTILTNQLSKKPKINLNQNDAFIPAIENIIVKNYNIRTLHSKSNKPKVKKARRLAFYVFFTFFHWSKVDIARHFNISFPTPARGIKAFSFDSLAYKTLDDIFNKLNSYNFTQLS